MVGAGGGEDGVVSRLMVIRKGARAVSQLASQSASCMLSGLILSEQLFSYCVRLSKHRWRYLHTPKNTVGTQSYSSTLPINQHDLIQLSGPFSGPVHRRRTQ